MLEQFSIFFQFNEGLLYILHPCWGHLEIGPAFRGQVDLYEGLSDISDIYQWGAQFMARDVSG